MKRSISILFALFCISMTIQAQIAAGNAPLDSGGMALGPARFELEMKTGTETTVVVNLDYHLPGESTVPTRIVASLNDWNITKDGRVEYYRANTQPNSASSWMIYSPGEASVTPGTIHQIRVTISVPADAAPGDHLAALIIEQRPETLKYERNVRQMIVRYRMASVFYIKVPGLTREGDFGDLYAESAGDGIVVTPTFKNKGNSVIRPIASVKVIDAAGQVVADTQSFEPMPVLGGSETRQSFRIEKALPPGNYSVRYRVDFQDGRNATEGVADLLVKTMIASSGTASPKP
jgi:hypothetical protein